MNGDRIVIFDTTLRDGEQSPGCSMNTREKLEVARALVELGVDDRQADLIADMAIVDPSAGGNPLPLTKAGVAQIFDAALHGRL